MPSADYSTHSFVRLQASSDHITPDSLKTGINRTYRSPKPAEWNYSCANRSSESQQQLPAALPGFCGQFSGRLVPLSQHSSSLVGDLVVQTASMICSITLVHDVLHRSHLCTGLILLLWEASWLANTLI